MLISSTQDREKVTRQHARQIVSPIPEPPFFAPAYTSEFIVKIDSASEEPSTPTKKIYISIPILPSVVTSTKG